jgi:hypothetical protein
MTERMTIKLMATVAFGGGLGDPESANVPERHYDLDPELAAADLRQAGYEVSLLPDKYTGRLAHPLDHFIEAVILGPNEPKIIEAIADEVGRIVGKYGGLCIECGPIGRDYVPFAALFESG